MWEGFVDNFRWCFRIVSSQGIAFVPRRDFSRSFLIAELKSADMRFASLVQRQRLRNLCYAVNPKEQQTTAFARLYGQSKRAVPQLDLPPTCTINPHQPFPKNYPVRQNDTGNGRVADCRLFFLEGLDGSMMGLDCSQ